MYFYAKDTWFSRIMSTTEMRSALEHPEIAKRINEFDEEGLNALMVAARFYGTVDGKLLLEKGASTNLASLTPSGNTALHFAVLGGNIDLVRDLLAHGADVDARNNLGDVPLFYAIDTEEAHLRNEVVKLFLEKNAALDVQNNLGMTVLHKAVENRDPELIDTLITKYLMRLNFDLQNQQGQTAEQLARFLYHPDMAEKLETAKAQQQSRATFPITANNERGFSSLVEAVTRGDLNQVDYLIGKDVPVNQHVVKDGNTPLHLACFFAYPTLILYLLEHKADVSATNNNGDTPLLALVNFRDSNEAKKVLQHFMASNADINAQNKQGDTLLHRAVSQNNKDLVNILLGGYSFFLNLNLKNNGGKTAFDLAKQNSYQEIVEIFDRLTPKK